MRVKIQFLVSFRWHAAGSVQSTGAPPSLKRQRQIAQYNGSGGQPVDSQNYAAYQI